MNDLEKLLFLRGVASEYFSYAGERVEIPYELRLKYLQALGYDINDAEAISRAIFELDAQPWQSWLQPFNVLAQGESEYVDMRLAPGELDSPINWCLTTETGETRSGHLVAADLQEVGDYTIDKVRYSARRLPLDGLPCGYHKFTLAGPQQQASATLVVAPAQCYAGNVE
ncbi:MAG: hypothetical protein HKO71_06895, partial [Pseudomonadales bacterium]|nr:hypothetical protein [Pseudomonadales bacterium]